MKCEWRNRPWVFEERKYVRWWSCSRSIRAGSLNFAWVGEKSRAFRMKLRDWTLRILGVASDNIARIRELEETAFSELKKTLGNTWFYRFRCWIQDGEPPLRPVRQPAAFEPAKFLQLSASPWEWQFRRWVLDGKPLQNERDT